MKKILQLLRWLLPLFILAPLDAADAIPAAAFAIRARQTKERIEILFRHHDEPPPRISPNQNPFRLPGDTPVTLSPTAGQPTDPQSSLPASDEARLKLAVATFKIGGTATKGQISVTINGELYQEGKTITAQVKGMFIYGIRIRRITPGSVTFALNDAEITQPF